MAYRYGECLVKEGEVPKGLFVIISGHCVTCSENLNMRSQKPSKYCRKINDNKQLEESFDLEKIDELVNLFKIDLFRMKVDICMKESIKMIMAIL